MSERVCNISERGARRRRLGGVVWAVIGVAAFALLLHAGSARGYRLVLAIPFLLSALGFFQAREMTCVFLGAVGKRETDAAVASGDSAANEQTLIRRQMTRVVVQSVVAAAVATFVAWRI
jgi:hypothetical protein